MADQKISQLPTITGANMADNDKFVLVDTSGDATVATTREEFFKSVPDVTFGDNDKAIFGAGSDLQIYHDGSDSYIEEAGAGNLRLRASSAVNIQTRNAGDTAWVNSFVADDGLGVRLFTNGSKKLETTSTGIDVTGTVTSDGLTVDGELKIERVGSDNSGIYWNRVGTQDAAIRIADNEHMNIDNNFNRPFNFRTGAVGSETQRMQISQDGDISFYEDTGTTAKFFWDSSAESLGIGTSSPAALLHIGDSSNSLGQTAGDEINVLRLQSDTANTDSLMFTSERLSDGTDWSTAAHRIQRKVDATGMGYLQFGNNSTDLVTFGKGNNEYARIDGSGNVGIGTSSPTNVKTQINGSLSGTAGTGHLAFGETSTPFWNWRLNTSSADLILDRSYSGWQSTPVIAFDRSSGNVGIGTTSPSGELHVKASSGFAEAYVQGSNSSSGMYLFDQGTEAGLWKVDSGQIAFGTSNSERMRINSNGRITTFNTGNVNGALNLLGEAGSSFRAISFEHTNGGGEKGNITTSASSTSYNTSSDYRLKENVVDLTGASARVNQLDVKRFNFIADETNTLVDGFLAHEVATVVPEAITGTKDAMMDEEYEVTPAVEATYDDDGNELTAAVEAVMGTRSVPDYQGIDQSKLVPLLTAALQEALTEIASLKTRVEALEG